MSAQFARAPHRGSLAAPPQHLPHAALLIDFDNVTMGIRSDLSKELKNLLSSDFIKGKVAVQRAYADWRRYPQYIVPLAESSVDLIFAPAYGSSKKNATDIRLAIDALELVFTRPEIGTFILLSGDSDFSSLVLKLKEYGKYVVGVGIRESASDLLVQNCDEYYSYSALTGLTRAGDEPATTAEDPWELVEIAIKQMVDNDDVMRSDRLKQVILEMDPSFDEKTLGFQKFNRFMQEAASRGLVSLRKLENGQFEVGPPGTHPPAADDGDEEGRGNGRRRSRRGRGRDRERDRDRDVRREEPRGEEPRAETPLVEEHEEPRTAARPAAPAAPAAAPAAAAAPANVPHEAREHAPTGRAGTVSYIAPGGEETPAEPPASTPAAGEPAEPVARQPRGRARGRVGREAAPEAAPSAAATGDLRAAYDLLRRAVTDATGRSGGPARDSDVKRRMLELQDGWDESSFGFTKFSRFLRQAHDAEVINLRQLESGAFEVTAASPGVAPPSEGRGRGRERGRASGRERAPERAPRPASAPEAGTQATHPAPSRPAPEVSVPQDELPLAAAGPRAQTAAPASARTAPAAPAQSASAGAQAAAGSPPAARGVGMRRGSRGRSAGGPPPLLEGQAVVRAAPTAQPLAQQTTGTTAPPVADRVPASAGVEATRPESGTRPARGARKDAGATRGRQPAARQPAAEHEAAKPPAAKHAASKPPAAKPASETAPAAALPRDAAAVVSYLTSFKGVGPKSVQSLVDAFGPARVFDALEKQPDRVREVVGGARGERLLEAWQEDVARRGGDTAGGEQEKGGARPRRRGGRKRRSPAS